MTGFQRKKKYLYSEPEGKMSSIFFTNKKLYLLRSIQNDNKTASTFCYFFCNFYRLCIQLIEYFI
jgi:hypothetical protein